jgi:hypothetical protein
MSTPRFLALVIAIVAAGVTLQRCSSQPEPAANGTPTATTGTADATPVLSVRELMEHIIDPTADWIFDAAVVDVTAKGTSHTSPVSDEDWLKVERGALLLAESANLLKMPRSVAPGGAAEAPPPAPGQPAPELSPREIEVKINQDRARWNRHADELKAVALDSLKVVHARDAEGLFQVGSAIDKACESCHLEYWYPGDKAAVEAFEKSRATVTPPK